MNTNQHKIYFILTVSFAVLILYFSLIPEPLKIKPISNFDKAMHFLSYLVLSFLCYKTTDNFKMAILLAGTYGLIIEFIQLAIPYRHFEIFDILINYAGAYSSLPLKLLPYRQNIP
ncbi:MAG: VanZ family protein [Candidatus Ratteibacteria bacterium]|nr:VanZ family protein [Candidatus Ratteibacteria bacterium]